VNEFKADVMLKRAKKVVSALKKRNIDAYFISDREEALKLIIGMIPEGATVALGGSVTIIESGLVDLLRKKPGINLLDRYRPGISREEVDKMRLSGLTADCFITGTNALTLDGRLVNIDGLGNRVAAMAYGPGKVIVITGYNKIMSDVYEGIKRIKEIAAPANTLRVKANTPCNKTGFCDDEACFPPERICNIISIIEGQRIPGRMSVVILAEPLGF
jgi:L-lactate utilization protein LutB